MLDTLRSLVSPVFLIESRFLPCCSHPVLCCYRALDTLRSLVSPVFFSTQEDGTVVQGLGALPADRWARAACFRNEAVVVMPGWAMLHFHRLCALGAHVGR